MATYAQTTIHSRVSKFEKVNGDGTLGRIVKGTISGSQDASKKVNRSILLNQSLDETGKAIGENKQQEISQEIRVPRSRRNISQAHNKKSNELVLFESSIFPAIYFKKTTMRSVLKEFIFPPKSKALPPNNERTPLVFQIVANLFNEITFYVFNLLVTEDLLTKSYYVFFSDSETIPFTKCCQAPVHIEMQINATGKIMCNAKNCTHPNLAEFLISYEDGRKLWDNMTFLPTAPSKDLNMKNAIARFIGTGKYKSYKLNRLVNQTSKQVNNIFQRSKFDDLMMAEQQQQKQQQKQKQKQESVVSMNNQQKSDFITNPMMNAPQNQEEQEEQEQEDQQELETEEEILDTNDKNVDILKMKVHYMAKREKNLQKKLVKSIVEESKVFHKRFEMIEKIDELLGTENKSKSSKMNRTKINFPKLMSHIKTRDERRAKSMSRTQNNSFKQQR